MAARKIRKFHTDEIRAKIQASQLINRLTDHALGKIELTSQQVRSIEILLKKAIPDLQSVELTNHEGDAFKVAQVIELKGKKPSGNG